MSDTATGGGDSDLSPVYGLKKDLIRLIGNLVHKCKPGQDLVCWTSKCVAEMLGNRCITCERATSCSFFYCVVIPHIFCAGATTGRNTTDSQPHQHRHQESLYP